MHRNNKMINTLRHMLKRKDMRYSSDGVKYKVMPNGEWRRVVVKVMPNGEWRKVVVKAKK